MERCVARDEQTGKILHGDPDLPEPWQDPAVWEMIAGGNARAVHHIESPAMTSLCRMCNVREIDGLIAIVSVIRPGAANEGKKTVLHPPLSGHGTGRLSASVAGNLPEKHLWPGRV